MRYSEVGKYGRNKLKKEKRKALKAFLVTIGLPIMIGSIAGTLLTLYYLGYFQ